MPYTNVYLRDFVPVLHEILKEKKMSLQNLHLEIIDEETEKQSIFEPAGVDEVLEQLSEQLNYLTIYTERPEHFADFAKEIYEENGLMILLYGKKELKRVVAGSYPPENDRKRTDTLVLDFEWDGNCYFTVLAQGKNYIPIYKKPWKIAENLDIIVPFGYNTVIVKSRQIRNKKPVRDRFEEAFYSAE